MRTRHFMVVIFVGLLSLSALSLWVSLAQEDEYNLGDPDVFGMLRRPPVRFSHLSHSESLADAGCGICHHNPDGNTGKLVYIEGEELGCNECHDIQKENHKPALREAYHGSCTVCHRDLIKTNRPKAGPTTCGGCHEKTYR